VLEKVEYPAYVRMRDLARKLDFPPETLVDAVVRRDFGTNGL